MKSLILLLSTLILASTSMASEIATCTDPDDRFNEINLMMIRETSAGKIKLMQLTVGGTEYFNNLDGSLECFIDTDGPIGGVRGQKSILCELPSGLDARLKFSQKGPGSAAIFEGNRAVASFAGFECN